MNNQENYLTALHFVSFEYFTNCVKNGATPTQAKKEMLTKAAQETINKKINELLKA